MIVRLIILAVIAVGLINGQAYKPEYKNEMTADKDFLLKQKRIISILYHMNQPELRPDLFKEGNEYNVEAHMDNYTNKTAVKEFMRLMKHGFLPHDTIYSIYYPHTIRETTTVFRLMYYAKDFDTFYKTALFLRNRLNHGLFGFAFYLAVMHRPDTKYIRLPPIYELAPHFFYNVELIEKAHHFKEFGKFMPKHSGGRDAYVIPYNYSNYYLSDEYDYEQRLNYFTEDIGLNNYYFFFRNNFPFFMAGEEMGSAMNYRGEDYLYGHKLLFNRYFLERMSNDLGHVEDYNYNSKFYAGYWPTMSYPNGMHFPSRSYESYFPKSKYHMIHEVEEYESRISQAVDSGIAFTKEGKTYKLYNNDGLNVLGNMIEGNMDSVNRQYYGNVEYLSRKILGFNLNPLTPEKLHPSALEHYVTSLRDPAFWRITKRMLHYYEQYKHNQKPYKPEEIEYPDFKIENVNVDKLETYFDYFDSSISHNLAVNSEKEADEYIIQARQKRLNHKNFNIHIDVNAAKPMKAVIRIFLGPKFNVHNREVDFTDHHDEFYEMDNFIYDMAAGSNKIVRNCHDFYFVDMDPEPTEAYFSKLLKGIEGSQELKLQKRISAFPVRMILPRGKPEGMPFQMFIHVAPVQSEPAHYSSSVFGESMVDNRPLGYPLDRPIDTWGFDGPNFYFKDVMIYHKKESDFYMPERL